MILERQLGSAADRRVKNEVIDKLRSRNSIHRSELNDTGGEPLICVGNGVVDVNAPGGPELLDHSPDYKFTRGIEYDYDPNARGEDAYEFLCEVTKREEDARTLIQHLGNGLMPGYRHKAFVLMYGPGDNGKTQVGNLFERLVGDENTAAVKLAEITDGDFGTGSLPGKMINLGNELAGKKLKDASALKQLTGGDTMRANAKHQNIYSFNNEAAMFFAGNEPPVFAEKTDAIKSRLYPIRMPFEFTSDPNDGKKDADDGKIRSLLNDDEQIRGLLTLAIEGARELEETGQYAMPETADERMQMYEAASDPIRRFITTYLEEGDENDVLVEDDAFAALTAVCHEAAIESRV